MRIMVTGGAGFIGSALVRRLVQHYRHDVLCYDALTYAGNRLTLAPVAHSPLYRFVKGDVRDQAFITQTLQDFEPDLVLHLAAETHVDRSIDNPEAFVETNILGTHSLLEAARDYWSRLPADRQTRFRLLHVSTDEVYGTLGPAGAFTESSPYAPNSPYAASKASSDHLVRAWHRTFGLPVVTSHCSNNYGPYQYPEKLIPVVLRNALSGAPLPIYGAGNQIRDWLHVDDHVDGLFVAATRGEPGQVYNFGADKELTNLDLVTRLCALLDEMRPAHRPHAALITHVADRPGHDVRYALDSRRTQKMLGWAPRVSFEAGLRDTVAWYLAHPDWLNMQHSLSPDEADFKEADFKNVPRARESAT